MRFQKLYQSPKLITAHKSAPTQERIEHSGANETTPQEIHTPVNSRCSLGVNTFPENNNFHLQFSFDGSQCSRELHLAFLLRQT
jgi:hypothetical protein